MKALVVLLAAGALLFGSARSVPAQVVFSFGSGYYGYPGYYPYGYGGYYGYPGYAYYGGGYYPGYTATAGAATIGLGGGGATTADIMAAGTAEAGAVGAAGTAEAAGAMEAVIGAIKSGAPLIVRFRGCSGQCEPFSHRGRYIASRRGGAW
jgi:hypothetical protein